ncbi:MAG: GGDEF domain-containing protein [Acidimicrobiales bacterium]|jgi:diguanylate cyclase (GGDEF)-like protein
MSRKEASFGAGPPPPPPSGFFQGLLDSLPAVVLVLDAGATIRFAAGQLHCLGHRTYSQLVGSKVGDLIVGGEERLLLDELLDVTTSRSEGEMVGPVRLPYEDLDGTVRLTEVWAVNCSQDPGMAGLVLIVLPESAYSRFDEALAGIVTDASLDETFDALAAGLRVAPVEAECFFVRRGRDDRGLLRTPGVAGVPGPPTPGPWDEIWAGANVVEHENLAQVSSSLRELAKRTGFASLACFAVHHGLEGRADACLVAWFRQEGRLPLFTRLAIERAVLIGSLAMSHRSEDEGLKDATSRDPLTGLGNRRTFFQALEALVDAGEQPAILYIDLDGFKAVNEHLGHLAGDAVLRVAARRLSSIMRPTDELARLGGDEFAVLCNGNPSAEQMVMIAERVVEQLSLPLSVGDGESVDVAASIGIALGLPVGTPVDTILGRADHALHNAKAAGRGQWALAGEPD